MESYSKSSTRSIVKAVEDARADRLDNVDKFLSERYGPKSVAAIKAVHEIEEHRPIETRWEWSWP